MCVVSNVGDDWNKRWYPTPPTVPFVPVTPAERVVIGHPVSRGEFDQLKAEFEQLRAELAAAKALDAAEGNPDCDNADKFTLIRELAEHLGVDLADLLSGEATDG